MQGLGIRVLLVLVATLSLFGCSGQKSMCDGVDLSGLLAIKNSDPVADEAKAFAAHDYRFMGTYGYTVIVPGMGEGSPLVRKYGKRMIEGTTDAACGTEHLSLIGSAQKYAVAYNRKLASDLMKLEASK